MAPLTAGLLMPANFPPCIPLQDKYGQPHCFAYAMDIAVGYYVTIAAVVLHVLAGFDGSPTHKFLHRVFFPEEGPPPPHWPRLPAACRAVGARLCRSERSSRRSSFDSLDADGLGAARDGEPEPAAVIN